MGTKVAILGCGRWAGFHAWYQSEKLGNEVLVWGREGDPLFEDFAATHKNGYLTLNDEVKFESDLKAALDFSKYVIVAISAQAMRDLSANIARHNPKNKIFVLCMKGIDCETCERLSVILREKIDETNKICVWVGPGHVQEFTEDKPNVMVIDGDDKGARDEVYEAFASDLIRIYRGNDLIGTEFGAASKNVLGIAAGMLDGAGLPSLKGPLMARGMLECARLIVAEGGNANSAYGIAHVGDFEATLFSGNSHNRKYGEEFVKSKECLEDFNKRIGTAEGVPTSKAFFKLAEKHKIEMPIAGAVYKILHEGADIKEVFDDLMREVKGEEF
ncbi:MAG: glycerol-3-phosphate dehydrogenase [Christensenellaceae bacterium]|jgi:glycerol-3-phosphate dehydrogenase (NAD(P)+)|nr:glycerol-3-phosphate dehydrogenase [Christensenellaceae bacterium]